MVFYLFRCLISRGIVCFCSFYYFYFFATRKIWCNIYVNVFFPLHACLHISCSEYLLLLVLVALKATCSVHLKTVFLHWTDILSRYKHCAVDMCFTVIPITKTYMQSARREWILNVYLWIEIYIVSSVHEIQLHACMNSLNVTGILELLNRITWMH